MVKWRSLSQNGANDALTGYITCQFNLQKVDASHPVKAPKAHNQP